jgi:phage shock protein PspC (stress-responsive transcriptional regulator)
MVRHRRRSEDRCMTETQNPPPPAPGVDRHNLRNYERLTRSTTDRKVAGVAGGLGRHLNVDPTVLRVVFVVLCFFGGAGLLLYGVAWLLVPEDGAEHGTISTSPGTRNGLLIVAGLVAVLILLGNSWNGLDFPWPLFVVGIGAVVFLLLRDQRRSPAPAGVPDGTGSEQPPPPPWVAAPPPPPARQPAPRRRGPLLFGPTLALVALALGALGLYEAAGGTVLDTAYPALALAVVGLMLVVGAFVGRAGGLVLLGLVAAGALALVSLVGGFRSLDFSNGQRIHVAPTTAAGVRPVYDLTSGRARIDLSGVRDPGELSGRTIRVTGRAGDLTVVLPPRVESDVTAHISGPGQVDLPDRSSGGFDTTLAGVYGTGRSVVTFDTRLSAGHIDIRSTP